MPSADMARAAMKRTCRSGCACSLTVRKKPPNSHATLVSAPRFHSSQRSSVTGLGREVPHSRISSVTETARFDAGPGRTAHPDEGSAVLDRLNAMMSLAEIFAVRYLRFCRLERRG